MSLKPSHFLLPFLLPFLLLFLLGLGVAACSGSGSDASVGSESESQSVPESGESLKSPSDANQAAVGIADAYIALKAAPCAKSEKAGRTLVGSVFRRSAAIQGDGIGTLLLLVVDLKPGKSGLREDNTACQVATVRYANVDLNEEEVGYPFKIPGVPARVEPYFVLAIFDDDGSLPKSGTPRLEKGHLVATVGGNVNFPSVVVSEDPEVLLNLNVDFLYNVDPVGIARFEGDWVSVLGPEAQAELDAGGKESAGQAGAASLTIEGESLTLTADGEEKALSYAAIERNGKTILTTTDSKGESKSLLVTFSKKGVMTWSATEGSNSADSLRWRRK